MQLTINGELRDVAPGSITDLLQHLAIDPRRVAIELNQDILPKANYDSTTLKDGDSLEIVHFVGGG